MKALERLKTWHRSMLVIEDGRTIYFPYRIGGSGYQVARQVHAVLISRVYLTFGVTGLVFGLPYWWDYDLRRNGLFILAFVAVGLCLGPFLAFVLGLPRHERKPGATSAREAWTPEPKR